MNNVTGKTEELVKSWMRTRDYVRKVKSELNRAEVDAANAQNELGKWLVPPDSKKGEVFNIWFGSGILQAQSMLLANGAATNDFIIQWRREPDGKDRQEYGI